MCQRLAQMETRYQDQVYALYRQDQPGSSSQKELLGQANALVMEGGDGVEKALKSLLSGIFGEQVLLETAMGIEAQGLDLYLRMSYKLSENSATSRLSTT
ncbi:hypothetical protein DFAR_2270002 [Desulfarculales bacterium]